MSSQFNFEAIGTKWKIDIFDVLEKEKEIGLEQAIIDRVNLFDSVYSRFRADSWLARISGSPGTYDLPPDGFKLLSLYQNLFSLTVGRMTPLIGQTLIDAGYDKEYSFDQKKALSTPPAWNDVIELSPTHIIIKRPAQLDLGAIGKGYIIDIIGELLESDGVGSYCVDAGGDIGVRNAKGEALRVGLEHPLDTTKVIGVIQIENKSIAGSSGNRRKWKNFNHIIDPASLSSPKNIAAIWVVAETTMLADALTTALYFTPADILREHYDFDYLILYADMSAEGSLLQSPMLELYQ